MEEPDECAIPMEPVIMSVFAFAFSNHVGFPKHAIYFTKKINASSTDPYCVISGGRHN